MSVLENIKGFCETLDFEFIILLPWYAQLSFIITSHYKLKNNTDDKTIIAERMIQFFQPTPTTYMPIIQHKLNTCWIASSIWFASSMTLYLNMLDAYKETELHPTLQFLVKHMRTLYDSPSKRKSAAGGNWDSILGCLVNKGTYVKGDDLDISRNWDDIIDVTPDIIRNQLFGYQKTTAHRDVIDKGGDAINDHRMKQIYEAYIEEYNNLYDNVVEEFSQIVNKNKDPLPVFRDVFGSKITNKNILEQPSILPPKMWEKAYEMMKGDKKGVINMDRFCGNARGFKTTYNRSLCDMASVYKDIRNLQSNFLNNNSNVITDYGVIIAIDEAMPSIQAYFTSLKFTKPLIRTETFGKFDIKYKTTIKHFYTNKTYIAIKIGYNLDPYTGDAIFPENFEINRFITIENSQYELTAVAVKSGGAQGGHWWCLVKSYIVQGNFISYNDIDNNNPIHVGLDYVNTFTFGHHPSLLCYTKKPKQYA